MRERISKSLEALEAHWTTVTIDHGELCFKKPYLEGDISVTTYDTLLYTFYGLRTLGHHILLPVGKAASSLIVMDEAQLLQDNFWYSMALLPSHVHTLLSLGAQIVVMTATMPPPLKKELLDRYSVPKDVKAECIEAEDKPSRGEIEVELRRETLPVEEEALRETLEECDPPILIVLNKVTKSVEVYRALKNLQIRGALPEDVTLRLLHSRLRRGMRSGIEKALEREGEGDSNLILIATQVIEAGLDYNFRTLITELSPVDSLIQRIGRIARRRGVKGRAIIYLDLEASRNVYPDSIMEGTLRAVERCGAELSEAPSNLEVSSELLGDVYTEDAVKSLQKDVRRDIGRVRGLIKGFPETLLLRVRPRSMGENLIRLGFEIRCWLADREYENRIMCGEEVEVRLDDYHQNIISLSMLKLSDRQPEIPEAIIHEVDGRRGVIKLEVKEKKNERGIVIVRGEWKTLRETFKVINRGNGELMFLLKSDYYEKFNGEELGVVRPWR